MAAMTVKGALRGGRASRELCMPWSNNQLASGRSLLLRAPVGVLAVAKSATCATCHRACCAAVLDAPMDWMRDGSCGTVVDLLPLIATCCCTLRLHAFTKAERITHVCKATAPVTRLCGAGAAR